MAIACAPDLIVCDEPTTGLDVTTQAEVVQMLTELIRSERMAAIYISHDLALLGAVADELAIFYAGEIVEIGPTAEVLQRAPPPVHAGAPRRHSLGPPAAPRPRVWPASRRDGSSVESCPFAPRCPWAIDICRSNHPDSPAGRG